MGVTFQLNGTDRIGRKREKPKSGSPNLKNQRISVTARRGTNFCEGIDRDVKTNSFKIRRSLCVRSAVEVTNK